jgi:nitroreductase
MIMNETLKVINHRRSVRTFKREQITESELQALLEAAIHAPSAINQQRWHFTVVQDKALLDLMVDIVKENIEKLGIEFLMKRASAPGYHTFHNAPTAIMISADEKATGFQIDCGAAAENILIAAESMNLGACIMTQPMLLFMSEKGNELRARLGIPDGYNHVCTVVVGYKTGDSPLMPPRKTDVVSYVR